jgi:hypothetical protein
VSDFDDGAATEYGLVMPFKPAVKSGTGPYDDQSFVAGYQAGQIDRALSVQRAVQGTGMQTTVYTELIPQLDLIAMRYGFELKIEETGAEGWSFAIFHPPSSEEASS